MQDVRPNNRAATQDTTPANARKPKNKSMKTGLFAALIVVILIVAGGTAYYVRARSTQVDSSKYQAVFLDNNQVYFGKLHGYNTDHPYLKDVWYIQTPDTPSGDAKNTTQSSQLQLQQLTKSVHGPENEMLLNKSNILFVENLTSDSKVTKLIDSSK